MKRRTLSSRGTFVVKWLFPLVWSGGWGYGTLDLLLNLDTATWNGVPSAAPPGTSVFMWVVGTVALAAFGWGLKRVRVEGDALLISNYLREIRVPLADVLYVRRSFFPHAGGIRIGFRAPTPFGYEIVFIGRGEVDARARELDVLTAQAPSTGEQRTDRYRHHEPAG